MEFENELSGLFDSASAALRPPIEEILEHSSARGQTLRRRRRGAMGAVSALSVAAIAGGAAFGVTHLQSASPTPVMAAAGSSISSAPVADTQSAAATTAATGGVTHATDYDLLKSLLPAGAGVKPVPHDWGDVTPGAAEAIYDDGHGRAQISVSAEKIAATPLRPAFSCATWSGKNEGPRPAGATPPSCTTTHLADGDTLYSVVSGNDPHGYYDYEVQLKRTDGVTVIAWVADGLPEGTEVDVTRAVPPLTIAQLTALVETPGWHVL